MTTHELIKISIVQTEYKLEELKEQFKTTETN